MKNYRILIFQYSKTKKNQYQLPPIPVPVPVAITIMSTMTSIIFMKSKVISPNKIGTAKNENIPLKSEKN